jgi:hypothetical protein
MYAMVGASVTSKIQEVYLVIVTRARPRESIGQWYNLSVSIGAGHSGNVSYVGWTLSSSDGVPMRRIHLASEWWRRLPRTRAARAGFDQLRGGLHRRPRGGGQLGNDGRAASCRSSQSRVSHQS